MTVLLRFVLICGLGLLPLQAGAQTEERTSDQLRADPEAGAAAAQFALAERYHSGTGVLQNFATAADLYRQAAEQGHAAAQNRLGQYHHAGLGVAQDQAAALHWLGAAAAQGDAQHLFDLAKALEQGADGSRNPERAAPLYEQASALGHLEASVNLAVLYQDGLGVDQDFTRALELYQAPVAAGHARAQNNLGLLYVRGTGVEQDHDRAASLFAAAADQGLATAMTNLSVMYANGFGVPQSDAIAAEWERRASQHRQDGGGYGDLAQPAELCGFDPRLVSPSERSPALEQAAEQGDPVAQFLLGWQLCTASAPNLHQAARWFHAAAEKGHAVSMANLGRLYLIGRGVPQDYQRAYQWLTLAQSMGLSSQMPTATALRLRMTPAQINAAQAAAEILWQGLQAGKR